MVTLSQNGWPAIKDRSSSALHIWTLPTLRGDVRFAVRGGSAGFLLMHNALRFDEMVQPIKGGVVDDWGWAYRSVRGFSRTVSNHASGTAVDLNAARHPLGKRHTFTADQREAVHESLRLYDGCVGWGGDYQHRADEMHFEIQRNLAACERVARRLIDSPRGKRILAHNADQRAVILR